MFPQTFDYPSCQSHYPCHNLPSQSCIYTSQGLLMCNKETPGIQNYTSELPYANTDIKLNIYQPFYNQTIVESLQQFINKTN